MRLVHTLMYLQHYSAPCFPSLFLLINLRPILSLIFSFSVLFPFLLALRIHLLLLPFDHSFIFLLLLYPSVSSLSAFSSFRSPISTTFHSPFCIYLYYLLILLLFFVTFLPLQPMRNLDPHFLLI